MLKQGVHCHPREADVCSSARDVQSGAPEEVVLPGAFDFVHVGACYDVTHERVYVTRTHRMASRNEYVIILDGVFIVA